MTLVILLIAGAISGTLAGLFGTGGGLIYVPLLIILLPHLGFDHAAIMHVAVATSLSVIVVSSISSAWAHHKHKAVLWPTVFHILPGLITGAIAGTILAHFISGALLQKIFAIFALVVSLKMLSGWQPKASNHGLPKRTGLRIFGVFLGGFCAMLGIGGGAISVPFFRICNMPIRNAIASSAALTFPTALTAAIVAMLTGANAANLPAWTSGYIYWPAFLGLMPMAVLCAPIGARLAHRLPTKILSSAFAIFLIIVAVDMWQHH